MSVVLFYIEHAMKIRTFTGSVKSDVKYRRERNPLFSLAPPHLCGAYALRQPEIRKRGTRESANLRAYDRWIVEACANIASYGRAAGNVTCIHDCIARVSLISRLHAVCLSATSVSLRLQGTFGIVYGIPITAFHRSRRVLLSGVRAD